jgi:hypothetical protein
MVGAMLVPSFSSAKVCKGEWKRASVRFSRGKKERVEIREQYRGQRVEGGDIVANHQHGITLLWRVS